MVKAGDLLAGALCAEEARARLSDYLAGMIGNGRVRANFRAFSKEAISAQQELIDSHKGLFPCPREGNDFCKACRANPESFSLAGALQYGVELSREGIACYKRLSRGARHTDTKKRLGRLLAQQKRYQKFLTREQRFDRSENEIFSLGFSTKESILDS